MKQNKVLAKFRAGQTAFGLWMTVGSTVLAEELAMTGLDWALIDTQHGYWNYDSLLSTIQILSHAGMVPITRSASHDPTQIGHLLDMGALGIIVPMVDTRQEAERLVEAVRYPPQGKRSAGGSRLRHYGQDYFIDANPEILLCVMIETKEAVARADEILSVPGVDCCYIGPGDLAISLGTFGRESAEHEAALLAVLAAGKRHGVPVGVACGNAATAVKRAQQGFQFIDAGGDIHYFWDGLREARRVLADSHLL